MRLPDVALLSADDEERLGASIELGLVASKRLDRGTDDAVTRGLLERIVAEGRAAEERMWLANLRLVAWMARSASGKSGLPIEELFQAGCEGLGEAIRRWDYRMGTRFATFAIHRVRALISKEVRTRSGAQSEYHGRTRARVVRAAELVADESHGADRTRRLAEVAGCSQRAVEMSAMTRVTLDAAPDLSVAVWFDEDALVESDTRRVLRGWIEELPGMEKTVIERRFGLSGSRQTQTDLAHEFHTSPSTIWRIERRAIGHLRELADAA